MNRVQPAIEWMTRKLVKSSVFLLVPLFCIERIIVMSIRKITQANIPTLRYEVIGYSAAGKSSLYEAMKMLLDRRTPSGIFLRTDGSPDAFMMQRKVAKRRIATAIECGMQTTVGAEARECFKFTVSYKTETMANGELNECMGQAIENPEAHPDEYQAFVDRIPHADVIWIALPLSQIEDETAFGDICKTCENYLNHALAIRRDAGISKPPVVGVLGTKMDTLGPSSSKVAERLASLGLNSFGEIPGTIREHNVQEGAVFPTSFFGCGKAVEVPGKADEYKLADTLRKPEPENIDSLVYWSLAAALKPHRSQPKGRGVPSLGEVFDKLCGDLKKSEPFAMGIVGELIKVEE